MTTLILILLPCLRCSMFIVLSCTAQGLQVADLYIKAVKFPKSRYFNSFFIENTSNQCLFMKHIFSK